MDANTMTLATQMAMRCVKQNIRDEGRKVSDFEASELRALAAKYLRLNPQIIEAAAHRIANDPRFAKFKTSARRKAR
jgi:hypothetical protein